MAIGSLNLSSSQPITPTDTPSLELGRWASGPRDSQLARVQQRTVRREPAPDPSLLAELGVGAETWRMLRALEVRDIEPNDYDVLLRLHSKPNTKTRARPPPP